MNQLCTALAIRGITTIRFEFPYMKARRQDGRKRPPDRQPVLLQCWRDVYASVASRRCASPLFIGGKSMGGRMATLVAEALQPAGFCCFGYPFHPPGKPEKLRTEHFGDISLPGLILQGRRDAFGKPGEIDSTGWGRGIQLVWLEEGDHDYRARKASGFTQAGIIQAAAGQVADFVANARV
jgi:predicted alpha/beta-hydrolase family hydrolase